MAKVLKNYIKTGVRLRKMVPKPNFPILQTTKPSSQQPFTVIVEGNIGSGKTSFLKYFSQFPDVCVMQEPVDQWRNVEGHNLLDLLYGDPSRWSLAFQTHVQLTMLDSHTRLTAKNVKLMERSIFSGRYCFIENLFQSKLMSPPEYAVLSQWFDWIVSNIEIRADLIVYLRTDPEVLHERILQRGRNEEKTVSLDYLKTLHEIHENWLHHKCSFPVPAPVVEIDANVSLSQMFEQMKDLEKRILFATKNSAGNNSHISVLTAESQ